LLPAITNDELLELIVRAFEEGAKRVDNYAALLDDPGVASTDMLNEGLAFSVRLDDHVPWSLDGPSRVEAASRLVDRGLTDLKEAGEVVRTDA
jgi:hypothetical protein